VLRQQAAWRIDTPTPWNGGVLATGGNLVFQGHIDGTLNAFDARSGQKLWSHFTGNAVLGAPISYRVRGRQYVSVVTGPPAGAMMQLQGANSWGWRYRDHPVRLVTYALDGNHALPPLPPPGPEVPLQDPGFTVDAARAAQGALVYFNCIACHGPDAVSLGSAPDLRASPMALSAEAWRAVVRDGSLRSRGMPGFPELDDDQLLALRHYLRSVSRTAVQD
jgi:quinohemoprotein ethanol dehydrogenase